jgi:hypothetical protein
MLILHALAFVLLGLVCTAFFAPVFLAYAGWRRLKRWI